MASRRAFTLMEVLVVVVIAGLVISAGFRLIALSLRSLAKVYSVYVGNVGGKIVEVDAVPGTFELDVEAIKKRITHNTKVILVKFLQKTK